MSRIVKFNYFKPRDLRSGRIYDLSLLFNGIISKYNKDPEQKEVYSFEDSSSSQHAKLNKILIEPGTNNIYQLNFERLRDYQLPVRTTLTSDSTELDLDDDEFIGEEVVLLYDATNHLIMLQKNIHSLSARAIELFFNTMIEKYKSGNSNIDFVMEIILDSFAEETAQLMVAETRKITTRADQDFRNGFGGNLINLINNIKSESDSSEFKVEISITATSHHASDTPYLPEQLVSDLISLTDKKEVDKLRVRGRGIDDKMQEVDVLSQKLEDVVEFPERGESRRLHPNSIFSEMKEIYNNGGMVKALQCLAK